MSEYLAIKNWDKYQPGRSGKSGWVKDYTDKDCDHVYMTLTGFQRYILDGCCRLRGRSGRDLPNDPEYVARALQVTPKERHCVPQAIRVLTERGFLIPSNHKDISSLHKNKRKTKKEEKEPEKKEIVETPIFEELILLPEEIPAKLWEAYLEMRRKKRAPATDHAQALLVKKLLQFKAEGHDIGKILENSITGNWTDVYPPKQEKANGQGISKAQQRENRLIEQARRFSERSDNPLLLALSSGNGGSGESGLAGNAQDVRPARSDTSHERTHAQSAKAGST